jgi:hypothetical protein
MVQLQLWMREAFGSRAPGVQIPASFALDRPQTSQCEGQGSDVDGTFPTAQEALAVHHDLSFKGTEHPHQARLKI